MLSELDAAQTTFLSSLEEIQKNSQLLLAQKVLQILEDIPVEVINTKAKRSFRVKALRDNGYQTIADIASSSVHSLSSVYGISEDAAYSIKQIANEMTAQARKGCKIRLSTDNKTKEASDLILSIYRYKQIKPLVRSFQQIVQGNRSAISAAISDLKEANGTFKWLFTSKAKKQKTMEAFTQLTELQAGLYWNEAESILFAVEDIQNCSGEDAWRDFTSNLVQFFYILEEINPGILGNDDALYGLPEDLARDIQEECFFLDGLRYQEWGVKYILHQECVLLGDEMGLGKTVQAIAVMVSLKTFLVVCLASVITNWCMEIRKTRKLTVTKVHGGTRRSAFQSWLNTGGVAVTTYETTAFCRVPEAFRFSLLVNDTYRHYLRQ